MPTQEEIVALRKESVDRNAAWTGCLREMHQSLSARRAWIEISGARALSGPRAVALRKESVDRNNGTIPQECKNARSLSARRAWIEIS